MWWSSHPLHFLLELWQEHTGVRRHLLIKTLKLWHFDQRLAHRVNQVLLAFPPCQVLWLPADRLQRSCYISSDLRQSLYPSHMWLNPRPLCTVSINTLGTLQKMINGVCSCTCLWTRSLRVRRMCCMFQKRTCVLLVCACMHICVRVYSINFEQVYNDSVTQRPTPHPSPIARRSLRTAEHMRGEGQVKERERRMTEWHTYKEWETERSAPCSEFNTLNTSSISNIFLCVGLSIVDKQQQQTLFI